MKQVWDQVWDQVGDQVWDQVGDQVWDQVGAQVRDQVRRCGYGQHDASWMAFYSFFSQWCGLEAPQLLSGLITIAESCGWWWPFEGAVILTERPEQLHRDAAGRLHSEYGPALLYPDGWGVWAWHGVRIPQHVIEHPTELTVAGSLREQNAEIRRVMLARIGPERLESDGGLEVVDVVVGDQVEVGRGIDGLPSPVGLQGGRLLRMPPHGEFPPMQWVSLLDSTPERDGSEKQYFLRVPPDVLTVRDAVAWIFDVSAEEYRPTAET